MSEKTKDYGKSVRSRLLKVSKQYGIFYQTILTRYFQERLLYRISQTRYKENFYLKGGALMYAYERFAARPTLDIDFLGNNISNDGERIVSAFKDICAISCKEHTPYTADTMFFREDFASSPQMQTRWKAFIKKIGGKNDMVFADVVTYLQTTLRPYWEELGNKQNNND